ncbi:hypothetical protein KUC3_37820 [Alteromonas sp. KC3]|uniref:hypothetical protein n=1 Tax=Alteromonas TaxID=226 RepID=UPI0019228F0E|nr:MULTISPECIES: hypothetical protein [unclassified Alteromonas]BCO20925.1 hypothetical protein KUC3_37820 [Alteromonas sp. KC3]BCO24895.1 hypothetical protein KUC14_37640 [Alteromonas sp. KC14]
MLNQTQVTELNDSIDNLLALVDYDSVKLGDILSSNLESLTDLKHHLSVLTEAVELAKRQTPTLN